MRNVRVLTFDLTFGYRNFPHKLHLASKISESRLRRNYCHVVPPKNRLSFGNAVNKNKQHAISEPFYLILGSRKYMFNDDA
jgi:hypothetical protein